MTKTEFRGSIPSRARFAAVVAAQQDLGTSLLDLQSVMDVVTERARELCGASGAVLELLDGDDLVATAVAGSAPSSKGQRVAVAASLSGLAVRTRKAQRCDNAETDDRVDRQACRRVGVRSMAAVPLLHDGAVQGVLKVLSDEPAAFTDADVEVLELMAGLMAAVLARAQRFAAEARQTAALRDLDELKGAFLTAASHDLRSPLAGILGFAELLESAADQLTPDKIRTYAGQIQSSARQVQRLIANLLDVERLSQGAIQVRGEPVALHELVRSVIDGHVLGTGRRLVADLPAVTVDADPALLKRVIDNLIGNAVKYTPADATIWVRLEPAQDAVELVVEDDGHGVAPDDVERIFEPFQRGSDQTDKSPGTGVGLHLAARFVEVHEGSIWVENRDGGGASFHVRLPATTEEKA